MFVFVDSTSRFMCDKCYGRSSPDLKDALTHGWREFTERRDPTHYCPKCGPGFRQEALTK